MSKPLVNIAAPVRQRRLEPARKRGVDFQFILVQYAVERLLCRFSRSAYKDRLVLKGARTLEERIRVMRSNSDA